MELLKSAWSLLFGVLKRIYVLLPAFMLDPFDFAERFLKMNYDPPQWLMWVLFGFGLAIAVIWTYHDVHKQLDDRIKKRAMRETLGRFLDEGNQFTPLDEKVDPPEEEILAWAKGVADYLSGNLGSDYKARFYDSHGLPVGFTYLSSPKHRNLEAFVKNRLARIQQFLAEMSD